MYLGFEVRLDSHRFSTRDYLLVSENRDKSLLSKNNSSKTRLIVYRVIPNHIKLHYP